jgi:dTDP-4-amino-4,6-dideoxygalactose transaminase
MEAENIPFARPSIGAEEEEAVLRVLRSGWLTTGAEALAFEEEFAAFLEGPPSPPLPSPVPEKPPLRALAVNSATSGLHLALEALGVGPGDLVLAPSYTFASTAGVVRYLGAEVVFVDVSPGTFHLDPWALENTLARLASALPPYPQRGGCGPRGRPRALIPVHYGGLPCGMGALRNICRRYDLGMVEDAAHSFPSRIPAAGEAAGTGSYAGALGDAGVFSFYATKPLATGEGGMVVTRNKALADRISVMRSHGIDRTVWNRYTDRGASWYYEVIEAGFKDNLPDLLAALGRVQLKRAPVLLERRLAIARRYDEAFGEDRRFLIPPTGPGDARHLYPLRLRKGALSLGRDEFIRELQKRGIGVSVHFIPLHLMPYYKKRYALEPGDFPESLRSFEGVISLPIWPDMGEYHVERVIHEVKAVAGPG